MKLRAIGPNQTELTINENTVFFSYNTPVAACVDGVFYRTTKYHSVTTSKHINKWLDSNNVKNIETKDQSFFDNLSNKE